MCFSLLGCPSTVVFFETNFQTIGHKTPRKRATVWWVAYCAADDNALFLPGDAIMHKRGLYRRAVSARLSARRVRAFCRNE